MGFYEWYKHFLEHSHLLKQLQYSATGEMILIIAGNCRAKVVDRDGFEKLECAKGDPYIVDMTSTKVVIGY